VLLPWFQKGEMPCTRMMSSIHGICLSMQIHNANILLHRPLDALTSVTGKHLETVFAESPKPHYLELLIELLV
jgi:hypothetical protein